MDARDRPFVHELVFGVSRLRGRLDHLLDRSVHGGLGRLEPAVLEVLRLAAYQLLYMDSVPPYAAISQAVSQTRKVSGAKAAGLANAVLRKVAGEGDGRELFPDPEAHPVRFLSTWGSHPAWLVERWLARWPFDDVRALVSADNRPPALALRPLAATPQEAVASLAAAGIEARPVDDGSGCVLLPSGTVPEDALAILPAVVQDPGAALVAAYATPPSGTMVADLCAAPGGKVLVAAGEARYTVACDRSELRMGMVRDNARRTGRRVGLVVADARRPAVRDADVVLLDVPCTGTGTLRRHPDARWRLTPESVGELAGLQRSMLEAGADLVRPGGLLVYSTCTLEPEENEDQVERFLESRPDFAVEPGDVPSRVLDGEGRLVVLPWKTGFDGAFAARLRRVG